MNDIRIPAPATTVLEMCSRAADTIAKHGWRRGAYWDGANDETSNPAPWDGGPCCVVGALNVAIGNTDSPVGPASQTLVQAATRDLAAYLRGKYGRATDVVTWNDDLARDAAEVIDVLRAVAAD